MMLEIVKEHASVCQVGKGLQRLYRSGVSKRQHDFIWLHIGVLVALELSKSIDVVTHGDCWAGIHAFSAPIVMSMDWKTERGGKKATPR